MHLSDVALITARAAGPGKGAEEADRFGSEFPRVVPRTFVEKAAARFGAAVTLLLIGSAVQRHVRISDAHDGQHMGRHPPLLADGSDAGLLRQIARLAA